MKSRSKALPSRREDLTSVKYGACKNPACFAAPAAPFLLRKTNAAAGGWVWIVPVFLVRTGLLGKGEPLNEDRAVLGEVQSRMVPPHKATRQPVATADGCVETPSVKTLPEFLKWTQRGLKVSRLSPCLKHRLLLELSKTLPSFELGRE